MNIKLFLQFGSELLAQLTWRKNIIDLSCAPCRPESVKVVMLHKCHSKSTSYVLVVGIVISFLYVWLGYGRVVPW